MLNAILAQVPGWYWALATGASLYYGARGVVGQRIAAEQLNASLKAAKGRQWEPWEVLFVRYIQDFIFHFVCSYAGFLALFVAIATLQEPVSFSQLQPGTAVLVVFSFLLGLVGVCGQLPHLLLEGRFPKGS